MRTESVAYKRLLERPNAEPSWAVEERERLYDDLGNPYYATTIINNKVGRVCFKIGIDQRSLDDHPDAHAIILADLADALASLKAPE